MCNERELLCEGGCVSLAELIYSWQLKLIVCLTIVSIAIYHWAIFLATCLAILLGHKLHEPLPGVTCPEMNMPQPLREVEVGLLRATVTATKTLRDLFISGHVTLRNDLCNLCRNGATRLPRKLPSVTVVYTCSGSVNFFEIFLVSSSYGNV